MLGPAHLSSAILPAALLLGAGTTLAAVAPVGISARDVQTLTAEEFDALTPYTEFARAAYCDPSLTADWTCGEACDATSDFVPTLTGGDGDSIQEYYVGYWPTQNTVIVAHEGTDPTQLESDLTDVDFFLETLNSTLFPGVPSSVEAHNGFADEQAQTAEIILAEVQSLMSQYSTTSVTVIGHSLGGAIAELDCLYFALNLPAGTTIKGVTYGTPRVGNPDFVTYFDSLISDFTRVNNEKDLIPTLPGRFLGFQHPKTEVHIVSGTDAIYCLDGDDDGNDAQCTDELVPNIFDGDILNHLGPYNGIYIGTIYCT